jgi:hypothetical protein
MQEVSRSGFVISELHKMATNGDIPPAVKVRALELMGKTVALFTDRVETKDTTDSIGGRNRGTDQGTAWAVLRAAVEREKRGGVYCPTQMAEVGLSDGPLSASVSVSRSRCQVVVPVHGAVPGSDAWCEGGAGGGSDRIGGAGGSTGKRHPVDPTHPLPPRIAARRTRNTLHGIPLIQLPHSPN